VIVAAVLVCAEPVVGREEEAAEKDEEGKEEEEKEKVRGLLLSIFDGLRAGQQDKHPNCLSSCCSC